MESCLCPLHDHFSCFQFELTTASHQFTGFAHSVDPISETYGMIMGSMLHMEAVLFSGPEDEGRKLRGAKDRR